MRLLATAVVLSAGLFFSTALRADGPWVPTVEGPLYFAINVKDPDRSAEWYGKVLGLRKLDDTSADDGSWRIVNMSSDALFVEIIRDDRAVAVERARGIAKVGFSVPDLEAVAGRAEKELGERPRILEFRKHGIRLLQLRDPDGNILQLSSKLAED